jgi:lipopolysaccharide/colanic/teichoic acid biosynthesis glycosyltransferase
LYLKEFSDQSGYIPRIERLDSPKKGQETKWLKEYRSKVDAHEVVGVIVGYNEITNPELFRELIDLNRDRVIDLQLISRIAPIIHRFEILESPTIVRINEPHIVASGRVIKRLFDLLLSVSLLILTFPLMLLTAILVKLTSKGPILYIDRRVGQNGEAFIFPKFRSMYKDADEKRLEILGRPDEEMLTRYKNDPRITPIGRFIRRWSIDELPQLWCVLTGTMSIVGPRPVLFEELSQIDASLNLRFIAKPGLTGLWQVSGRKEVDWEGRMLRDISYVDRWSLSQDLVLILRTIITILSGKGAF